MKIIIIGNGIAGQTIANNLRKNNKDIEIVMISKESHPYYSRIYLPHYIADEYTLEKLYQRKIDWYKENNINLMIDSIVTNIDTKKQLIMFSGDKSPISYDKLVLAVGSTPRLIPFGNPTVNGLFTLRTISDADEIKEFIKSNNAKKAFIIGGGLLGIELGFHLRELELEITICEIFPYLLPRQLDERTSELLKNYLESKDINFILGKSVKNILGNKTVEGIEMENGEIYKTDIIFEQLGIIPNTDLAKISGLKTEKGIIVNEFMQTSNNNIYAAGDCIQYNNQIWGIIPASLEQAKLVASHILGDEPEPYTPSTWINKLKIAGLDLTCIGPPKPTNEDEADLLWNIDAECNMCRKVIIERDKLTGAILMGEGADTRYFIKNYGKKVDKDEIKHKIHE